MDELGHAQEFRSVQKARQPDDRVPRSNSTRRRESCQLQGPLQLVKVVEPRVPGNRPCELFQTHDESSGNLNLGKRTLTGIVTERERCARTLLARYADS